MEWKGILKRRFESNLLFQEHAARYRFVERFVKGKDLLEVGCGIGWGTRELSHHVRRIVAIEIDRERIGIAKKWFSKEGILYIMGDGCSLPFKGESFDVVVSLEVIEHIEDQRGYLREIRRVLKEGGLAIISTPNREVIYMEGTPPNPFHVKELSLREFMDLLSETFGSVEIFGQRRGRGVRGLIGPLQRFVRRIDPFNIRRLIPRKAKTGLSEKISIATGAKEDASISWKDFPISKKGISHARNLIGICRK